MVPASGIDLRTSTCFLDEQARVFAGMVAESEELLDSIGEEALENGFLVCEKDNLRLLAQLAVTVARKIPVFLGNPNWKDGEWEQVRAQGVPTKFAELNAPSLQKARPSPGEFYIPTGGSSGAIKFARHTVATLCAAADALSHFFEGRKIHSWSPLPAYHLSGLMPWLRALRSGGKVYVGKDAEVLNEFPEEGLLTTSIVGTQLARMMEDVDRSFLRSFDILFIGGSPVHGELLRKACEQRIPLSPCYGSTETAAMISCLRPEHFLQGRINAGALLPHAQVKCDETGRIHIHASSLFQGYWPEPAKEITTFWQTDDLGILDPEGFLQIRGRADHIIISGGEKIEPAQVANEVVLLPGVSDAIVVPENHTTWGQQAVCILTLENPEVSTDDLAAELKTRLASFKIPKRWIVVDSMPYSAHGKRDPALISQLLKTHAETGQS